MKSSLKSLLPLIAILVCASVSTVFAQQQKFPAYTGHVNDFANVIDQQTEQKLETWLTHFENLTGTQIAVGAINSLEGRSIEDYALDLYRAWGIGAKSGEHRDKGALLIVSLGDRKTRLEVGYGLEGDLPDGLAGEIIRRMRPALQQGQYSQAMATGVRTLIDTLAEKWNVNIAGIEDRSYAYRPSAQAEGSGLGLPVIFIAIILFIIVMAIVARAGRKRGGGGGSRGGGENLWWLYPIIFNRGGGTFGGGSWGSTGGGGGDWGGGGSDWGGFGGGASGGGGASDSW
ncbi:MAG: TPM domain-containing protein [Blastocatellia bacterium]